MAPVRLFELYSVPGDISSAEQLVQGRALVFSFQVSQQPSSNEQCHEPMHIGVLRDQGPVKPAGLVVLAVGVVVATLGAPHFIAHLNHGQAQREQGYRKQVLHLAISQLLHCRIVRWALDATVPASVVVRAVAVVLAVRLVVLLVVRDEIVERKAVVTSHKVHALLRLALLMTVNLRAAYKPVGKARHGTLLAAEEATHIIAELAVPLPPAIPD